MVEQHLRVVALKVCYSKQLLNLLLPLAIFRSASPKHGFTIMNRLSMENRTEPITKDLDFQLQDPFLLYRNARCESFLMDFVVSFPPLENCIVGIFVLVFGVCDSNDHC